MAFELPWRVRRWLVRVFGSETAAFEEALRRSAELREFEVMASHWVDQDEISRGRWDIALPTLGFTEETLAAENGQEAVAVAGVSPGGRPRKQHPGIALREAARMLANDRVPNLSATARAATAKAVAVIDEGKIEEKKWQKGFTDDDAVVLKNALDARPPLVRWTPEGLQIREKPGGVFRSVDDFDWCQIPEPE